MPAAQSHPSQHPLFTFELPVGLMSGESPRFPAAAAGHEALLDELNRMGVQHEEVAGKYGGVPERSVAIYGLPREQLVALGKRFGQESVIHSEGGKHQLIYTNGPNAGKHHLGIPSQGIHLPPGSPEPADDYSRLPDGSYVRLAFDFDHLHPSGAGAAEVPKTAVAGPVMKREHGHELWRACQEILAKADPPYRIEDLAGEYMQGAGLPYSAPTSPHVTDQGLLHHVSNAYMALPDAIQRPEVRAAYDALKRETLAQYEFLKRKGFRFTPVTGNATPIRFPEEGFDPKADTRFAYLDDAGNELGGHAPYGRDFGNLYTDIWRNRALKVFTGGAAPAGHPLAERLPGNDPLGTYNNAFRAVHDVFGHALGVERFNRLNGRQGGYDFGHVGEDHAFNAQSSMYSPAARHALASETRGQNAAFHFGPNGRANRANPARAQYPEQKAILLPEHLSAPVRKNLNLDTQERSTVADDQKPSTVPQALHALHKGLKEQIEDYERQCLELRKAETARLEKKAPPGFSEETMHELKRKHGVESAFKIAWASYDKKHGRKPKTEKAELGKTSSTDGGMGEMAAAPIAGTSDDVLAESEQSPGELMCSECGYEHMPGKHLSKGDDEAAERYAKGEMGSAPTTPPPSAPAPTSENIRRPKMEMSEQDDELERMCKADLVLVKNLGGRMPGPDAPSGGAAAPAPPAPAPTPPPPSGGGSGGKLLLPGELARAEEPMECSESPMCKCASCGKIERYAKGELDMHKDEADGDSPRAPKVQTGSELAAGSAPESPGPKPGVVPSTKKPEVKLPQTKEGGNGVTIKKSGIQLPGTGKAAAPAAPKIPGVKPPKLPGVGKPAAPAAPKTPPMGAGTPAPNVKAEPSMAKDLTWSPHSAPTGPLKSPWETPPATPKQHAIVSSAPAPAPVKLPGQHLFAAPVAKKAESDPSIEKDETLEKEHVGFNKLAGELAHEKGVENPKAVAAVIGRKKYGAKDMAAKAAAGKKK